MALHDADRSNRCDSSTKEINGQPPRYRHPGSRLLSVLRFSRAGSNPLKTPSGLPISLMDAEKLAKLKAAGAASRIGGKGTPRRKVKRTVKTEGDDRKVQDALAKIKAQTLTGVEQVNMFKEDGKVIHVGRPAVQMAEQYNTFCISGHSSEKTLEEMLPEMIQSMGPESLEQLRKLTEQIQSQQGAQGDEKVKEAEDNDIPDLVEGQTFDNQVD